MRPHLHAVPAVVAAEGLPLFGAVVIDAAQDFALDAEARSTRRAYASDIRSFRAWCAVHGHTAVPALPSTVAAYLGEGARLGIAPATLGRRVAGIRFAHRLLGLDSPTRSEEVAKVMRGIRRRLGTAPRRKAPATADVVRLMIDTCDDTLHGRRDRALLTLGFAGAFRRAELVALDIADLAAAGDGMRVIIRSSKTDKEGAGQTIAIPSGTRLRPVQAVRDWLAMAGIVEGPLFRRVWLDGRVGDRALADGSVAEIIKARAALAGLDPTPFAGHSLRAGFLTSAARAGASIFKMRDQSRHRSLETMNGYVRDAELFTDHAGSAFL